jgi:hypothetical protein
MSEVRIALSKREPGSKSRHIVLRCPSIKDAGIKHVIRQYILPAGTVPVQHYRGEDTLLLFNLIYLDKLLLTFPDAEMSMGLRRRLSKQQQVEVDTLDDTEVECPGFEGEFWRFQNQGINAGIEHLEKNGVFMLNDEMGLGKTIQAIAMCIKMKRKSVLVVTTKSGCGSWAKIHAHPVPSGEV